MRYNPELNPEVICIVGVGGTGSHVAMTVGRMLYDMRQRNLQTPRLVLVDPDHVEPKNVGRQLFVPQDVGQPKAAVIARRLSFMLGIDVTYHHRAFDADMVEPPRYGHTLKQIVVGCVDGHEGRKAMSLVDKVVWIDAGNHYDSGQVVIGDTLRQVPLHRWDEEAGTVGTLPTVADWYPDLLKPELEPEPEVSCADLMQRGDQHLLINAMVAQITSNYVYKLLHQLPITSYQTTVDLELGVMKPHLIEREVFEQREETTA
jgi:PRTRC genetic system ThiF family protein